MENKVHKKKIVCLGDSITEGFGLKENENYPYLLQKRLGDGYKVVNAGATAHCVINETLPDGRVMGLPYVRSEKYAMGIKEKGDIYIVLLGTNDAQDGMFDDGSAVDSLNNIFSKKDRFLFHYGRILEDIRQTNPAAKIYIGRPTPILSCIWRKHQQKYLDVILEMIDKAAAQNPDITVIDFFSAFQAKGRKWLEEIYQEDGLHPGPKGAEQIAEIVENYLKREAS